MEIVNPLSYVNTSLSSPSTHFKLSPSQQAVSDAVLYTNDNLFVEAVAGSGKTTTCLAAIEQMKGNVAFLVFNTRNAKETAPKLAHLKDRVKVGTFHSFGNGVLRRKYPNTEVAGTNLGFKSKRHKMLIECHIDKEYHSAVANLVSLAKQYAVKINWDYDNESMWQYLIDHFDIMQYVEFKYTPTDEAHIRVDLINYAKSCLDWSLNNASWIIDFDDQLWVPLVEDLPFFQNNWVVVDEAQDTNPCRLEIASRLLRSSGRLLAVGDRNQSIFGFTGADEQAVEKIIDRFNCKLLPLNETFRCCKAAVEVAKKYVPEITAADSNIEGEVSRLKGTELIDNISLLSPGDAVICRKKRPLISLAYILLANNIPCYVEGRDIGKELISNINRFPQATNLLHLIELIEDYRSHEINQYRAKGDEYSIEALNDRIDSLLVICSGCTSIQEVKDKIGRLFATTIDVNNSKVTLSTIHKAKGREWDNVYILGYYGYMPSPMASKGWEIIQEHNLAYVAVTRAKRKLVLVGEID